MNEFDVLDKRLQRFSEYLNKLYFKGKMNLSELQSFRTILDEINEMLNKLRSFSIFGMIPGYVRKDMNKLTSEITLMEYNVSLISVGCSA